jgi:hypothetical protein
MAPVRSNAVALPSESSRSPMYATSRAHAAHAGQCGLRPALPSNRPTRYAITTPTMSSNTVTADSLGGNGYRLDRRVYFQALTVATPVWVP